MARLFFNILLFFILLIKVEKLKSPALIFHILLFLFSFHPAESSLSIIHTPLSTFHPPVLDCTLLPISASPIPLYFTSPPSFPPVLLLIIS